MPTDRIRYLDPASTGGNGTTDALSGANAAYASLDAALIAEADDLVTDDVVLRILFHSSDGSGETSGAANSSWEGFTTDATRYVSIEPKTAASVSSYYDTSKYRFDITDNTWLFGPDLGGKAYYFHITGLAIRVNITTGATDRYIIRTFTGVDTNSFFYFNKCKFVLNKTGGTSTANRILLNSDSQNGYFFRNCLSIISGTSVGDHFSNAGVGHQYRVYNCTIIGGDSAFHSTQGGGTTAVARNCIVYGATSFFGGTTGSARWDANYCSTDLSTAEGANSRVSQSFSFVNAGAGDYRLTGSDGGARDFGVDLSGDANLPVTDDIVGTTRPVNSVYDIGYHEFVETSGISRTDVSLAFVP